MPHARSIRHSGAHRQIQRVVRRPRIPVRERRNPKQNFIARLDILVPEPALLVVQRAPQQRRNQRRRQRLQNVNLGPRQQRRNHLKRWILRSRANKSDVSGFHVGKKRILLRLIEPVHLVHKHNRPRTAARLPLRVRHHFFNLFDPCEHRAERNELRTRQSARSCAPASSSRTPAAPTSSIELTIVVLDLHPQRLARPEQFLLSDKFIQRPRTHPFRKRLVRRRHIRIDRLWQFGEKAHALAPPLLDPMFTTIFRCRAAS